MNINLKNLLGIFICQIKFYLSKYLQTGNKQEIYFNLFGTKFVEMNLLFICYLGLKKKKNFI